MIQHVTFSNRLFLGQLTKLNIIFCLPLRKLLFSFSFPDFISMLYITFKIFYTHSMLKNCTLYLKIGYAYLCLINIIIIPIITLSLFLLNSALKLNFAGEFCFGGCGGLTPPNPLVASG